MELTVIFWIFPLINSVFIKQFNDLLESFLTNLAVVKRGGGVCFILHMGDDV